MKKSCVLTLAMCFLMSVMWMPQSGFALTWTYYDQNGVKMDNPTQDEINQNAATRTSDTTPMITQYALEIKHDFSGTWGTGYLENIGNPVPAVGKHWKTKDEKVTCEVDGIVPDMYNVNSRYITTAYRAKGGPNAGQAANAIQFDGVDDYVTVDGINFANVNNFSIEFWAKRDQLGRNECLFGHGKAEAGKGIEFGYWDSENNARVYLPGWMIWAKTSSATDTGWHQWRIEYTVYNTPYYTTSGNGFKIRIYRNNQLVSVSSGDVVGDVPPVCTGSQGCKPVQYTERECTKQGCDTKCSDVTKTRQECWNDSRCTDRAYTGVGAFYIGKGIGTTYFKGQMKDILIKVNGQIVGNWKFNDGNKSKTAADSSGYNRTATLNNFDLNTCWAVDPKITRIYDFARIQPKQIVPEFTMSAPSSIIYNWGKQFAVTVSTIPESRASKAVLKVTDTSGQDGQVGTGRFWYKLGTAMKLSTDPDDCMQLMGYRDNFAADPTKEIPSNEVVVPSLDNPLGITWVYSQYMYKETVTIGSPVSFSSVPLSVLQGVNLNQKPSYQPDASNPTPEGELFYWSASENKLFPVKPNQTFKVQWDMTVCPGTKLITEITTQWPESPHYVHVAQTPPINLDASADDLYSFKEMKYTSGDGSVTGKDFTASQPGKSVLVFTRGDVLTNPDPKEVSLTLNGYGYADAGNYSLNRQAFTIEFWAKRTVKDLTQVAIGQGTMSLDKGLMIGFSGDNSFMFSFFGNDLKTAEKYTDTDWHHWACVYEAQVAGDEGECFQCLNQPNNGTCRWSENTCYTKNYTGKSVYVNGNWTWDSYYYANRCCKSDPITYKRIIYRDGVKVAEDTTNSSYKGTGSLRIGSSGEGWSSNLGFVGQMDEVRIWETAVSQQTLRQNMDARLKGNETGLIGYWRFDNIGGSFENDSRILTEPLKADALDTELPQQPMISRTCLALNGIDQYAIMNNPFSDGKNFSIEVWVNPELIDSNYHALLGWQDETGKRSPSLYLAPSGGLQWDSYDAAGTRYTGTINNFFTTQSKWVHVAWVKDGTSYRFYKNGSLVKTADAPEAVTLFNRYAIGKIENNLFRGLLDEIRIWNIVRTEDNIKASLNSRLTGRENGLAAYYPIDTQFSATRSVIADLTANRNNGVMTNMNPNSAIMPSPAPGPLMLSNALNFDGVDDYVQVPQGVWFNGDFTVEAWVYVRNYNSWSRLIDFGNGPESDNVLIALSDGESGKLNIHSIGATRTSLTTPNSIPKNTWTHVAVTLQGTTCRMYMNGVEVASKTDMAIPRNVLRRNNYIGRSNWTADKYADAMIDELRISNIARSASEIENTMGKPLAGNEPGLKAYYDFNQTSGTVLTDKTAAKQDGTLVNMATSAPLANSDAPAPLAEISGNALQFQGSSDYVKFDKGINLANSSFTIEFWAKRARKDRFEVIFSMGSQDDWCKKMYIGFRQGNQFTLAFWADNIDTSSIYNDLNWHHWAVVYDSSTKNQRIYCDGVKVAERTAGSNFIGDSNFYINNIDGAYNGNNFSGYVDELRIWNIARTQASIQSTMNTRLIGNESGLVAYYDFNHTSGTTLTDRTSGGRNGTLVNMNVPSAWVASDRAKTIGIQQPAVGSKALTFNGMNQSVDLGGWFDYQTFTIAMWVKPGATQVPYANILDNNHNCNRSWVIQQDDTTNRYNFSGGVQSGCNGNAKVSFSLSANQWQHVAVTFDGTTSKAYVNGSLVGSGSGVNMIYDGTQFLRIGSWGGGGRNWNGQIDELSIWNVVKSQTDIQNILKAPLAGTEPGLLAYYDFNEITGNVLADKTTKYNGTLVNMVAWVDGIPSLTPTTLLSSAIRFDGVDDVVRIPNSPSLNPANAITIEGWIKPEARISNDKSTAPIIYKPFTSHTEPYYQWALMHYGSAHSLGGKLYFGLTLNGTRVGIHSDIGVPDNVWSHVAGVYDGSSMKIYINGVLRGSGAAAGTITSYSTEAAIGNHINISTVPYKGYIDDVRVWDIARSQADIQADMSKALVGNEANLAAYYNFETRPFADKSVAKNDVINFGTNSLYYTKSVYPFVNKTYMSMGGSGPSYLEIPDSVSLNPSTELTVEAWINADKIDDCKVVGKGDDVAKKGYVLGLGPTGEIYPIIWDTAGTRYAFMNGRIEVGQWTHIAMTWKSGGKFTGYINGFKVEEIAASTNPISASSNPLRIGAAPWNPYINRFFGKVDDVRIWNIERSQEDIKAGLMKQLTGKEPGLVAYYHFDNVQDTRLPDATAFNNKGVIIGATMIQEGLSDNVVYHPARLVNLEPSSAWAVNTDKLYDITPADVANKGVASVRVVETIPAESDRTLTGTATVGTELVSSYHGKDVPHNGYVFREIGPYNPDIYDRKTKTGAIYPVNSFHPSKDPKEDRLLVVWYRMQDGIAWSYQAVDYTVEWPQSGNRIVVASRLGSEGKDAAGNNQVYPDMSGVDQNYADPMRYREMKIYNQPDKLKPGYNPNEEHALVAPSFRNSRMSPQPMAAFALRNDLNIKTGDGFTSQPFVLVQYFDAVTNKYGMTAYKVETEDPKCGYTFNYDMKAGEPIVAPYPVNMVIGATPPREIFGKNSDTTQKCYWEDHKGQPWVISGAGKTVFLSEVTEVSPEEYRLKLSSETFKANDFYLVKVSDENGMVGAFKFKAAGTVGDRDNAPVQVNGFTIAEGDSEVTVTLKPGIRGLSIANFELYHYTSPTHVLTYFWYPLDPTFWINEKTPGNGAGDVGKPFPMLPSGVVSADDGFPENLIGKAKAVQVRYDITWPDNLPILKAGETLTFAGGEYRADQKDTPGLPGVLGWASGQVVFDELNPTMDEAKLFTHYQVRLGQVLEERSVDLKIDKFPDALKPAAKRVDVVMNRYYFKDLHAGLKNRICYDPMSEKLIFRGFVNDKTLGDRDLTASPPAVYVVQPNIMTKTELDTIKKLEGANSDFKAAVDSLYGLTRNPNRVAQPYAVGIEPYAVGIGITETILKKLNKTSDYTSLCQSFHAWFGFSCPVTMAGVTSQRPIPDIAFGPGISIMPNDALLDPATDPYKNFTEGFVTLAENNHPDMGSLPVALHIIKVKKEKYRGAIKTVFSDNVFDEKITLRHTADFGAKANDLVFDWRYREEDGTDQPTPDVAPDKWKVFPDFSGKNGAGMTEIALAGAGSALLSDNLFFVRYRHKNSPANDPKSWSDWAGAANSRPPREGEDPRDTYQAQLCEGWIKRVLNGVNPFEARIRNFYSTDNPATYISMIQQAGPRYEGPVAFNPQKDVIENVGLIELYQTVLDRGKDLSINLSQPVCTSGVTAALMLAASRISGFYTLLGNEAYNDALDPTIGYGTSSVEYGSLAPTIFAFTNQVSSLLEEELGLLRGRSEPGARPVYNRLMWNFTKDRGEAAYAMNYNITDVNKDGFINADDGQKLYPQGHGDAWGHYLSAVKSYYDLLRHPEFKWESRSEKFQIQGVVMDVDYLDERKFAEAAAAKAKVGKEITDLTYRQRYVADPDGQWQGYKDTNKTRAWGVSEWARRAFHGAFFDWAEINAILPSAGAFRLNRSDLDRLKEEVPSDFYQKLILFEDQGYATQDAFKAALTAAGANPTPYPNIVKYAEKSGLKQIDRTTVEETLEIASQARSIQKQFNDVNTGLNPLGLASEMVPFDIDPAQMANGTTQFEQIYERAEEALANVRVIFDYANDLKNRIRQTAVTAEEFAEQVEQQDRDYRNRLIETFGTPYEGVIGTGKVYPPGYQGPDYFLYNYIDVNEVSSKTVPQPSSSFKAYFEPMNKTFRKVGGTTGSLTEMFTNYFKTDLKESDYTSTDFSGVLEIEFPQSAAKYSFQAPAGWGKRKSPGEIQQALIELIKAEADLQLALAAYDGVIGDIEWSLKLLEAKSNLQSAKIGIKAGWAATVTTMNAVRMALKLNSGIAKGQAEVIDKIGDSVKEALPTSVGLAIDATSTARAAIKGATVPVIASLKYMGEVLDASAEAVDMAKEILELWKEFTIDKLDYDYEIKESLKELESILGGERAKRLEVFKARENMRQVSEKYLAVLSKGLRLMEERKAFNAKVAAKTQGSRYMDMNFRLSLNDALSKYRSMFDVAARFVFMAAKAYDYETNLSDRDPASPKPIIADMMRQRTLGQFKDGQYIVGQGGLGDSLARLKANFKVLKTQMGLNNPQSETSRMSLRYELFRIKKDASENEAWRKELLKCTTDNLWRSPEFRKFCRPFAAESAGAQPGLIIPFTTNIISGKNFFGWPLGGADHAYDPTNFATKVKSVGLWFEGYDNSLLSETPRAYLIPAGDDFMLVPNSTEMDTRQWTIIDQKIPVPLPVGASDLTNQNWFPSLDSLNGPMVQIRKFSSARAYHDTGYLDISQMNNDSRLIGRSVWNSRWLLIIPGATFHYDSEYGMNTFINTVTDIKLFFDTYAISGN